jgi:predicted kinase
MEKKDKKLIMFIGKTHSGKTTFAKELEGIKKDILLLEADPIALFMRENFPKLRELDDKEHSGAFKNVSLKYKFFLLLIEFSMSFGKTILLSNSNIYDRGRKLIFKLAKKYKYKIIGVYFNFPEEFLIKRINKSKRTIKILRVSKDFNELIVNQRTRMQIPSAKDFDQFYEIRSEKDLTKIKTNLIKII